MKFKLAALASVVALLLFGLARANPQQVNQSATEEPISLPTKVVSVDEKTGAVMLK